jgi:hypothetical protein
MDPRQPIKQGGRLLGKFEVWSDEEPVDAAEAFCRGHGLPRRFRAAMLAHCCKKLRCARHHTLPFEQVWWWLGWLGWLGWLEWLGWLGWLSTFH